jgi:RND family efflux transporter MFP subunit
MKENRFLTGGLSLLIAVPALAASACGSGNQYVEPPPPTVTVAPPDSRQVTDFLDFTGHTVAIDTIEIRARIKGYLRERHFEEGTYVDEGELLYIIEPDEYQARVNRAEAALKVAQTAHALSVATLRRMEQAYKTRAISELELLENRAKADASLSQIDAAKAELAEAKLDLDYTHIRAPMAGRVGATLVVPGNLVGASENTLLTTLVSYDPIYATFDVSERDLLALMKETESERATDPGEVESDRRQRLPEIPVELGRASDDGYPFEGRLDFSGQEVDAGTGTYELRAVLDNPQPIQLIPGLFVRVRVTFAKERSALLVSDRALGTDQTGKYVMVVGADNVVKHTPVVTGELFDGMRVIEKGLEPTDHVIVDGLLRARPGAKVNPQMEGAEPAAQTPPESGS